MKSLLRWLRGEPTEIREYRPVLLEDVEAAEFPDKGLEQNIRESVGNLVRNMAALDTNVSRINELSRRALAAQERTKH